MKPSNHFPPLSNLQYMQLFSRFYPPNAVLAGSVEMIKKSLDEGAKPEVVFVVEPRLTAKVEAQVERWTRADGYSFEWMIVTEEPATPKSSRIRTVT